MARSLFVSRAPGEDLLAGALRLHPSLARYRQVLADKDRHLVIVALGDSNTEVNWTTRGHLNWTGLVQAGLHQTGHAGRYTFINEGVSSNTTADALQRLDRDVIAYQPDLVIISLGTNDSWRASAEEARANLRQIIHRLREQENPPSILLRTPQPSYDVNSRRWKLDDKELLAVVKAILEVAIQENVAVIDHYSRWSTTSTFKPYAVMCDFRHPNELGHSEFYKELAPVLGLTEDLRWEKPPKPQTAPGSNHAVKG